MKTLNWYVTRNFLVTFFMSIGILTFGMLGGRLAQVIEMLAQGLELKSFLLFVVYTLPVVFTFTVPLAVMVSIMMVFGRMSADSEITAMRASGISILQVVAPILLITFLLTGICSYLQLSVAAPALWKARTTLKFALIDNPMALFAPGQQNDFGDKMTIYIDTINGDTNELYGIQLYEVDDNFQIRRDISAISGRVDINPDTRIMTISLYNCIINDRTSSTTSNVTPALDELVVDFDYGREINEERVTRREKFMRMPELLARLRMEVERGNDTTKIEVEINQRIAFALCPIAFLLFGLPLAIQTSRRETSVGLFLSVILAGGFYLMVTICESLVKIPAIYPQYLLWLPTLIYQVGGVILLYRISQR